MQIHRPEWMGQMEDVLEILNEGVLIAEQVSGRILFVSKCFERMVGVPRQEIVGWTREKFYSGDDLAFLDQQIARSQESNGLRYEFYLPRLTSGDRLPVIVSGQRFTAPDGRGFAVVTFTDISEQKETEVELKEAHEKLAKRYQQIELELQLATRVQQSLAPKGLKWGRVAVETY